jgi:hypothetical protein
MRIASAALAALLLTTPALAADLTATDIIEKNRAARGGAALAALKSVQMEGKLIFPGGFELTYNELRSGGAVRSEAALQAYGGKSAWRINPFQGRKDAETMTDDEARSLADSGTIAGPLLSAASDGSTVTSLGREDFDGTNCYKLKVVQKDGDEFVYLIDPDSMLEVKVIETRKLRGAVQVSESEMGDYEAVGGVMYPMSIETGPQGSSQRQRVIIAKASANVDAPATLFSQPK